jgi:NCAIR mutase (PurE)-related protein
VVHAQQTDGEFRLDHDRLARTGIAEAVYAPGKSPEQCAEAVAGLLAGGDGPVLLTRADTAQAAAALDRNPGGTTSDRTLIWRALPRRTGSALILTAGTSDLPAAREARAVLAAYGHDADVVADVGVAGLHRVLAQQERLARADVVLVVAGMEGALASVVAGLTAAPVIAVPTSTGYGAGLEGVTALLGMMASCSPGVTVVGIDNGFGAACAAVRILRTMP